MANPPRNTKENCKTLGGNTSKVAIMGLESTIRAMKKRSTRYGDMAIADDLNKGILKDSDEKINAMDIWRWWNKHKDDDDPSEDRVNIYGSYLSSLKSITRQTEMIEMYLDNLNSSVSNVDEVIKVSKVVNDMTATFNQLTMRKSALTGIIADIQAKIYTYQNFTEVLGRFEAEMKAKDELWCIQVIRRISEDPMLAEVLRKIKDSKGD